MNKEVKMLVDACEHDFDQIVLESQIPVIVDFWAPWCKPCKMMEPLLKKLAKKESNILFVKVDIEKNPVLAADFEITSIPCFMSFKAGNIYKTLLGYTTEEGILSLLD